MYYVLDENNNKVEAFSKEDVLAVLQQAIKDGDLSGVVADCGAVDKLKCCVGGETVKVAFITQEKYNELYANGKLTANTYYFITNDTDVIDIDTALEELSDSVDGQRNSIILLQTTIEGIINGENVPKYAKGLKNVTNIDITSSSLGEITITKAGLYLCTIQPSEGFLFTALISIEDITKNYGGTNGVYYYANYNDGLKTYITTLKATGTGAKIVSCKLLIEY